ncbi:MAG TPA: response regulator [Prolixibacteraceae bacterium]|nr:response regulator [Prolixibacteraceae bacterium]HPR59497.1 response regulator [Prolixibacteraceae bacterium]
MTERKKYKILVAEDNPINIKVSAFVLKPIADVIDIAQNGAEVLEKLKNNTYDVILMDVKMPIMDGYEATIKIRKMEANNQIEKPMVIIATTANSQPEEVEKCKSIGMNDLVVKPFSINDILAIIEH